MARHCPVLTEQQLKIMKVVWNRETATVRDVYETLRTKRQIAYTTVMPPSSLSAYCRVPWRHGANDRSGDPIHAGRRE